ncbi:cupin domain-containing protein [Sphingomonas nostoxanthinifaciens]|uniref:cupin domain-containing protein n=1 Tax=Sphingomonas nostoxanthinifaciens TaxID=2872652 RepID=UPI001CC1D8FD|nr:cupin domain-containing protein [Sphingomonas nostoxanthinifaciens]UAK24592.1 cupin domain-containing protein [Sphingomonas nostoxanthinifaciens]
MPTFNKDMHKLATANSFFQKEVYRDGNIQIVLMSLLPGEDIGEETHRADQTTYFVEGNGKAVLDGRGTKVTANHVVVIPQGTKHNIVNTGTAPLKLFSVYAPPAEEPGVKNRTKADAEAAEKGVIAGALETVTEVAKALGEKVKKAGKKKRKKEK